MHFQNLLTAANIRQRNNHLAVETAGTLQGRIQYVGTVGRGNDDNGLVTLKTVHFH